MQIHAMLGQLMLDVRGIMKNILILCLIFTTLSCVESRRLSKIETDPQELQQALARLTNDDCCFVKGGFGLASNAYSDDYVYILKQRDNAIPKLVQALDDPERFAIAHVLLVWITRRTMDISETHWNGMRITLREDGKVDYHPDQMEKIKEMWPSYLRDRMNEDIRHRKLKEEILDSRSR